MLTDDDKAWITELLHEKLEEVETRLLRAFRNFSHPVEGANAGAESSDASVQ